MESERRTSVETLGVWNHSRARIRTTWSPAYAIFTVIPVPGVGVCWTCVALVWIGFVPQRPASASHFTRNFIVFGTSGCGTISRALDEWGKRAFFQNGIANDCTFFDVSLAEFIVDAFAFSSEMNGDLIPWAKATGFLHFSIAL